MNVVLTPEQRKFIEQKVRAGSFGSASDVLREALEQFRIQESLTAKDVAELREAVKLGIAELDRGDVAEFDASDIKATGRKLLAARKSKRKRAS